FSCIVVFDSTPPTDISTPSLHDALPIFDRQMDAALQQYRKWGIKGIKVDFMDRNDQLMVDYYHRLMTKAGQHKLMVNMHGAYPRSEEHTSELQSRENLVCRLLLEKKNKQ